MSPPNTVKTHVSSLLHKLQADTRVQLAAIATRHGLSVNAALSQGQASLRAAVVPRSALPWRITSSDHPLGGRHHRHQQADWTCAAGERVPVAGGQIARGEVTPTTDQNSAFA